MAAASVDEEPLIGNDQEIVAFLQRTAVEYSHGKRLNLSVTATIMA